MSRLSTVTTHHDSAGDYEVEIFDTPNPKRVIVTAHGNGVRRWDGQHFFHNVAEHYTDSTVMLVDQNQPDGDGCRLNPLPIMVSRVDGLLKQARQLHPGVPIVLMGHSMGCSVVSLIEDLTGVATIVFVTPAAGSPYDGLIERYGPDIIHGQAVTTSDGLRKVIPKEYVESVTGLVWEDKYSDMLGRFQSIHCFEAGDEEIVGEARLAHRDLPFETYQIIPQASHNLSGEPLQNFFSRLDRLIK